MSMMRGIKPYGMAVSLIGLLGRCVSIVAMKYQPESFRNSVTTPLESISIANIQYFGLVLSLLVHPVRRIKPRNAAINALVSLRVP
jgi:hypothetical protein